VELWWEVQSTDRDDPHDDALNQFQHQLPCNLQFIEMQRCVHLMADATSGAIQSGRIFADRKDNRA
jgi:hypothetical protein